MLNWVKKNFPTATHIAIISKEASTRSFYRLTIRHKTYILMVYPEPAPKEISRIIHFSPLYLGVGVHVPAILENISDQALLQEDLGDRHLQHYLNGATSQEKITLGVQALRLSVSISKIPAFETPLTHDFARQKFEMDHFLQHYLPTDTPKRHKEYLQNQLYALAQESCDPIRFAHRDFHSRNIVYAQPNLGVVDFQDSMTAHPYYDLASFLWDAYIPWTPSMRTKVLKTSLFIEKIDVPILETVALQRTIKALGTFAYQVNLKKNKTYSRYIPRVIQYVLKNPQFNRFFHPEFRFLFDFYRAQNTDQT
jgi:aminoglycoside/choline kinase family phosphotransferase